MRFIHLTDKQDGTAILVDPSAIMALAESTDRTEIYLHGDVRFDVLETVVAVLAKIEACRAPVEARVIPMPSRCEPPISTLVLRDAAPNHTKQP